MGCWQCKAIAMVLSRCSVLGGQSRAGQIEVSLNEDIKSKEGRKNEAGLLVTKDNPVCAKAAPPRACTAGVRNTPHRMSPQEMADVYLRLPD